MTPRYCPPGDPRHVRQEYGRADSDRRCAAIEKLLLQLDAATEDAELPTRYTHWARDTLAPQWRKVRGQLDEVVNQACGGDGRAPAPKRAPTPSPKRAQKGKKGPGPKADGVGTCCQKRAGISPGLSLKPPTSETGAFRKGERTHIRPPLHASAVERLTAADSGAIPSTPPRAANPTDTKNAERGSDSGTGDAGLCGASGGASDVGSRDSLSGSDADWGSIRGWAAICGAGDRLPGGQGRTTTAESAEGPHHAAR